MDVGNTTTKTIRTSDEDYEGHEGNVSRRPSSQRRPCQGNVFVQINTIIPFSFGVPDGAPKPNGITVLNCDAPIGVPKLNGIIRFGF